MPEPSEAASHLSLLEAVRLFDRRERRAVVSMLGGSMAPRLSESAAAVLGPAVQVPTQELSGAPWFMDYTWNWLAGAMELYARQSRKVRGPFCNAPGLVEDNQEDVDALVVADGHLILIEVKWHGAWNQKQLERKSNRIRAFADLMESSPILKALGWHVALASRGKDELQSAAAHLTKMTGRTVATLPLERFFDELPTGLLEVPYVKEGQRWRIVESRGWKAE